MKIMVEGIYRGKFASGLLAQEREREREREKEFGLIWFGLVWLYSISTIVGYLMPNPLYTYILNI